MPTLYVENVPADLYDALKEEARLQQRSVAAHLISILEERLVTLEKSRRRRKAWEAMLALRESEAQASRDRDAEGALSGGSVRYPSTEEMIREDRNRA